MILISLSFAKEPYKRDYILQKRPIILKSLRIVATPYWLVYTIFDDMGWLRLVGSLKLYVSFAEYSLFYVVLSQKRPIILKSLRIVATPYLVFVILTGLYEIWWYGVASVSRID